MTLADRDVGARVLDFGFVRGAGLDGAEDAFAVGVAGALRRAGYEVEEGATRERGAVVLAVLLADVPGWLERATVPVILVPIVRAADELPRWIEVARRVRSVWTGSPLLADSLQQAGVAAHFVGLACQFGQVRHHARAAHGIRDEDFVFGIHPTSAAPRAELDCLRAATRQFYSAPASRFSKATVFVSAPAEAQLEPWRELAAELPSDAIVTARRPAAGVSFAGFAALADCELVAGAVPGLVPWNAAAAMFAGKKAITIGGLESRPFGHEDPPHLHRREAKPAELAAFMAQVVAAADADRNADRVAGRRLLASNAVRAVTVAIVAALQKDGMWHAEGGA